MACNDPGAVWNLRPDILINQGEKRRIKRQMETELNEQIFIRVMVRLREQLHKLEGKSANVFLCIALHMDSGNESYPSLSTIEAETGLCRNAIIAAIRTLEKIGWIQIKRDFRKVNKYLVNPEFINMGSEKIKTSGRNSSKNELSASALNEPDDGLKIDEGSALNEPHASSKNEPDNVEKIIQTSSKNEPSNSQKSALSSAFNELPPSAKNELPSALNEPDASALNEPPLVHKMNSKKNHIKKNQLEEEPIKKIDTQSAKFDEFWEAYPACKKIEKKRANNYFISLLKKGVNPDVLIRSAGNYSDYCDINDLEPRYVMHPTTFLNPANARYEEFINFTPERKGRNGSYGSKRNYREIDDGLTDSEREELDKLAECDVYIKRG